MHKFRWSIIIAALLSSACGTPASPSIARPGPDPSVTVALECPADISLLSLDGRPTTATFPLPAVDGVTIEKGECSPASGSAFAAASTTTVTCRTTATTESPSACSFGVRVVIPPRTSKVAVLAFGDSITQGRIATLGPSDVGRIDPAGAFLLNPSAGLLQALSYPATLQQLLRTRYAAQEPVVFNRGIDGERASAGRGRLAGEINAVRPDVLLLLEGVNDIHLSIAAGRTPVPVGPIAGELRDMVEIAQERGVEVLLATLTPVSDQRNAGWPGLRTGIDNLNAEIRRLASDRRLGPAVDLAAAFGGDLSLIGSDGLHPNEAGYAKIAETFLAAFASRFESTIAPQPVMSSSR